MVLWASPAPQIMVAGHIEDLLTEFCIKSESGHRAILKIVPVSHKGGPDGKFGMVSCSGQITGVNNNSRDSPCFAITEDLADCHCGSNRGLVAMRKHSRNVTQAWYARNESPPSRFSVDHKAGSEVRVRNMHQRANRIRHLSRGQYIPLSRSLRVRAV